MQQNNSNTTRRQVLKSLGVLGAVAATGASQSLAVSQENIPLASNPATRTDFSEVLKRRIDSTPMVDAHQHLPDEEERLANFPRSWIYLFSNYLIDDFISAGAKRASIFSGKYDPVETWRSIEPYWHAVKNTGYGRAAQITLRELYGVDQLNENTVSLVQQRYEEGLTKGMYHRILREHCNIEACIVDRGPFSETRTPTFLFQDINTVAFTSGDGIEIGERVQVEVKDLNDWHEVIRRFFDKYGPYATAVKNQIAYSRRLDFERVPAEEVEQTFRKRVLGEPVTPAEVKRMQDHLFWFCVEQANRHQLPVKLHTGYYAGTNYMPMSRVGLNPADVSDLCIRSPETRWIFMHAGYPYGDELISIVKHFSNAHAQMCWAWIIDPLSAKQFLQKYLVTAPTNKIHLFGGDIGYVENTVGHARIARNGFHAALLELVDEGYLSQDDAMELVEPLLRGNMRRFVNMDKKYEMAKTVPWKVSE